MTPLEPSPRGLRSTSQVLKLIGDTQDLRKVVCSERLIKGWCNSCRLLRRQITRGSDLTRVIKRAFRCRSADLAVRGHGGRSPPLLICNNGALLGNAVRERRCSDGEVCCAPLTRNGQALWSHFTGLVGHRATTEYSSQRGGHYFRKSDQCTLP